MTSIPEISARGSLILCGEFQIPVGPRSGREGEKCRPLDHIRQVPFIHSALFSFYTNIDSHIYAKVFQLFLLYGTYVVSWYGLHLSFTHAPIRTSHLKVHCDIWSDFVFHIVAYWYEILDIFACTVFLTKKKCLLLNLQGMMYS